MVAVMAPSIELEQPRLRQSETPAEARWSGPMGSAPAAPMSQDLLCQLVVADEKGRRRALVDVAFDLSVGSDPDVALLGHDESGALRLTLRATATANESYLTFSFRPGGSVSPSALMPILRWFEEHRPGRTSGIWDVGGERWLLGPDRITEDGPELATGYRDVVKALARIERRSGLHLHVPADLGADQVKEIELADRLLRGEEARGSWSHATLNDDPQMREILASSPLGAQLRYRTSHLLHLSSEDVYIGEVVHLLDQVRLSDRDEGEGPIRLVAGDLDGITTTLVSVPKVTKPDGSTSWVPNAMLDPYQGQWIAQSGTSVLASGPSRDEVVAAVRARGVLATVWHVPDGLIDGGASELRSA